MGAEGCLVAAENVREHLEALPTEVVDATGAGDCWDAGFVAALAHGSDVLSSARMGHAAASFCIQAVGGSAGVPTYERVRRVALGQA